MFTTICFFPTSCKPRNWGSNRESGSGGGMLSIKPPGSAYVRLSVHPPLWARRGPQKRGEQKRAGVACHRPNATSETFWIPCSRPDTAKLRGTIKERVSSLGSPQGTRNRGHFLEAFLYTSYTCPDWSNGIALHEGAERVVLEGNPTMQGMRQAFLI